MLCQNPNNMGLCEHCLTHCLVNEDVSSWVEIMKRMGVTPGVCILRGLRLAVFVLCGVEYILTCSSILPPADPISLHLWCSLSASPCSTRKPFTPPFSHLRTWSVYASFHSDSHLDEWFFPSTASHVHHIIFTSSDFFELSFIRFQSQFYFRI